MDCVMTYDYVGRREVNDRLPMGNEEAIIRSIWRVSASPVLTGCECSRC